MPDNSRVLDAGAGTGIYRHLFDHCQYESVDFARIDKPYGELTYICDLSKIPVEDERFDGVICTQVLEHLPDPLAVLEELHRVSKRGGILFASAPLFYEEHEQPYDFFRYTRYALRSLLERANFEVRQIDWLEGYCGTLSYQFQTAARSLPIHPRCYGGGIRGITAGMMACGLRPALSRLANFYAALDVRRKLDNVGYPINYTAVAVKR